MSGHSKWSTIKHKKATQDARRASVFTKLGNMISISASEGGKDLETNFKLKMAVEKARSLNMPKDNIERAIKRGTGKLKNEDKIEEIIYEAYFSSESGQIAMLIKTVTDNKNRTVGEIRHILIKNSGKLVASGSVGYLFNTIGEIILEIDEQKIDEAELLVIEAGAEDIEKNKNTLIIYAKANNFQKVKENIEKNNFKVKSAELSFIANQKNKLTEEDENKYKNLLEILNENDDVVDIYDNRLLTRLH